MQILDIIMTAQQNRFDAFDCYKILIYNHYWMYCFFLKTNIVPPVN